jgi:hypothetical protein
MVEGSIGSRSGPGHSSGGFSSHGSSFGSSMNQYGSSYHHSGGYPIGGGRRVGGPPMLFAVLLAGKSDKTKKQLTIVGIIIALLGAISLIYGFTNFFSMGMTAILFTAAGWLMILGGGALVYACQLRRISSYIATETAPAVTTATHAVGEGFMGGVNQAGGIQINTTATQTKEIVKVKCPHCGYLDSEEAVFCSKCGNKI